jgi:hypothetical protein
MNWKNLFQRTSEVILIQSIKQRKKLKHSEEEQKQENQRLLEEYYDTLIQLRHVRAVFQQVTDPELINACVYEMNALQQRYTYLLQRIKAEKLTALRVLK